MLKSVLEFNKANFYQEKVNAIGEVVRNYAKLKLDQADDEAITLAKNNARQTISSILSESGFINRDNSYISLDKEFFTSKGILDEESLRKFQREVVKHYGLQQLKWSFAGTTLHYTQITKRELKRRGIQYEDLLPQEIQKSKKEERSGGTKEEEPNTYRAFLYPDGSVSEAVIPEKMQIRFDNLTDQSGFDWKSGYSPDNEVAKKGWFTGFNKKGEWEKVLTVSGKKAYEPYTYSPRPIDFFTGSPDSASGSTRERDTIGIIQADDGTYLFDDYSFLCEDYEEFYYSITGEVYGAQKIDREKSLKNLKASLDKKGVTALTAVVLRHASKEAIKHYKTILKDYISEKTRFYSKNDRTLIKKLSDMHVVTEGKEVSNRVITDLHYLSKKGITKEELKKNLEYKVKNGKWEIPLQIFEEASDLETFLALPGVQEICEGEAVDYLKGMKVPEEKRTALSNTIQNLMIGYKEIFKNNPVKQIDVIQAAEKYIVKNKISPLLKLKVTAEESLYTIIRKAADIPLTKENFSVFIPVKKKGDYKDLFDEKGLSQWIREELEPFFPVETARAVENELKSIVIPESVQAYFSGAVQNIFPLFPLIAENTGMTPPEIIQHIKGVLLDQTGIEALKRKRIFFEKSIEDIVKESSIKEAPAVKVEEKEQLSQDLVQIEWKPFPDDLNLFEEKDLTAFIASPLIEESGFLPEEASEIGEYVRSSAIPEKSQLDFSRGIINIIRGYKLQLKPHNISLKDAFKALTENTMLKDGQKSKSEIDLLTLNKVMKVARTGKRDGVKITHRGAFIDSGGKLESLLDYGMDSFLSSGLISGKGIPREDALKIFHYLKGISIPVKQKAAFSRAVAGILQNSGKAFKAGEVSALDTVKAVSLYMEGKVDKIPLKILQSIKDIFNEVSSPGISPEKITGKQDMVSGMPGTAGLNLLDKDILEKDILDLLNKDIPGTGTVDLTNKNIAEAGILNLLNKNDYRKFMKSDIFKTSGLNEDQLDSIIQEYRKVYNRNEFPFRHFSSIPIVYQDDVSPNPPQFLKGTIPPGQGIKNSLFNVGFVLKAYPGEILKLLLTKQGKKAISSYKQESGEGGMIRENEKDRLETQLLNTYQDDEQVTENPYSFTQLYSQKHHMTVPSLHTEGQKKTYPSPVNKNISTSQKQKQNELPGKTHPGTTKGSTKTNEGLTHFQRMENNYFNDKQMLAHSSSESGSGKSSEDKKKGSKEDDNVIKQLSDDLVEEMKNKANEEGL